MQNMKTLQNISANLPYSFCTGGGPICVGTTYLANSSSIPSNIWTIPEAIFISVFPSLTLLPHRALSGFVTFLFFYQVFVCYFDDIFPRSEYWYFAFEFCFVCSSTFLSSPAAQKQLSTGNRALKVERETSDYFLFQHFHASFLGIFQNQLPLKSNKFCHLSFVFVQLLFWGILFTPYGLCIHFHVQHR